MKEVIFKNWKVIYYIQIIIFVSFSLLAFIYYWDKPAHQYFNRGIEEINLQSIFSLVMTYLFIAFVGIIFIYPIIYAIQIISLRTYKDLHKKNTKKYIILFVLYLLTIISVVSLLMINTSHSIMVN